ncbi:MAG: DUF6282 family protein, partial [Candidatus Methylarchaceae archaeon HK01M]|nr:DUF6282 family protein [Candidatus Methylarchaceae archaeon HK01M]
MDRLDLELLEDAIDMHVHTAPDLFPRSVDDISLAKEAIGVGLRALVLKSHFSITTFRSCLVNQIVGKDIDIFGALVMNQTFGGLNPYAVDIAIKSGAKIIWMPTNSARNHIQYYGSGDYGAQRVTNGVLYPLERGITPLDKNGEILPEMKEVLKLIAKANIVLATGHCSTEETKILVKEAFSQGVQKIIVTHPDFEVVNMPIEDQKKLARMGAFIERTILPITPSWNTLTVKELIERFKEIRPETTVISTDLGQINNPTPIEGYRLFIQILLENGLPAEDIKKMSHENPRK